MLYHIDIKSLLKRLLYQTITVLLHSCFCFVGGLGR